MYSSHNQSPSSSSLRVGGDAGRWWMCLWSWWWWQFHKWTLILKPTDPYTLHRCSFLHLDHTSLTWLGKAWGSTEPHYWQKHTLHKKVNTWLPMGQTFEKVRLCIVWVCAVDINCNLVSFWFTKYALDWQFYIWKFILRILNLKSYPTNINI